MTLDFYRVLFIVLLFALAVIKVLLDLVNLSYARRKLDSVPREFEDRIKKSDMVRIQDYTSAKTKVEVIQFTVFIVVLILLIFSGSLNLIAYKAQLFGNYVLEGLTLLFIILRLSEEPGRQASVGAEVPAAGGGIDKTAFLFIAWIANFASWFIVAMVRNIFPVLAVSLKMDPRTLGFLIFLVGFSQTWMFVLLRQVGGWHYRIGPLLICQALASVALVIGFLTSATILFALSFILIGTLAGMSYFSSIFYSQDSPTLRGHRAGYHESILGTGALLGPICGGLVAKYYDLRAPYISCLILVLGAMLVQVVIYRNSLRRKA